jgi:hypothetical protein
VTYGLYGYSIAIFRANSASHGMTKQAAFSAVLKFPRCSIQALASWNLRF